MGDVLVTSDSKPQDYDNDLDRGTVDYSPKLKNYCFHKVLIPKDTVVEGCNFSQASPLTEAITGNYKITFNDCNLSNVLINSKWVLKNCNTTQSWIVLNGEVEERLKVEGVDPLVKNQVIEKPKEAITERDF